MEFHPVTKSVEMFGVTETRAMTVASSAKVFYTLISGLYSRKIESICREIISNAFDGHSKQGNIERPFYVHAPSIWEPYFAVRDYGCSIDHETVLNNCSTIGWSSKENSNTEIGTWGYGMKSPFAYTSQFTLTCWKDGKRRVYSYHIDEAGVPQIALRDERDSDDEQGVEVRFDVKRGDIEAFHKAIRWVALPYKVCFESNLENIHTAKIMRDDLAFFLTHDADGPMVEVGPVWYKIDFDQLPDCASFAPAFKFKQFVLRSQIGELGIVPSRESLEYTPKTVASLTRLITNVFNHVSDEVAAKMLPIDNIWDAAKFYRSLDNGPFRHVANNFQTPWGRLGTLDTFVFDYADSRAVQAVFRNDRTVFKKGQLTFDRGEPTAVFVVDQALPGASFINLRMSRYMLDHGIFSAIQVSLPCPKTTIEQMIDGFKKNNTPRQERRIKLRGVYDTVKDARERMLKQIEIYGCPAVVYHNELPEPLRNEVRTENIVVYENRHGKAKWSDSVASPQENKINIAFELNEREFHVHFEERTIRQLIEKATGLEVGDIIGVSKSNFPKFMKHNVEWTSWKDVFNESFFDIKALKERIKQFNSTLWNGIDHQIADATRLERLLANHLTVIPLPIQRVFEAARLATIEGERRKEIANTISFGLTARECQMLIKIVTGEVVPINDETNFNVLEGAVYNMKQVYPDLMAALSRFDAGEAAAIYVLGIDALRAVKAVNFYNIDDAA